MKIITSSLFCLSISFFSSCSTSTKNPQQTFIKINSSLVADDGTIYSIPTVVTEPNEKAHIEVEPSFLPGQMLHSYSIDFTPRIVDEEIFVNGQFTQTDTKQKSEIALKAKSGQTLNTKITHGYERKTPLTSKVLTRKDGSLHFYDNTYKTVPPRIHTLRTTITKMSSKELQ